MSSVYDSIKLRKRLCQTQETRVAKRQKTVIKSKVSKLSTLNNSSLVSIENLHGIAKLEINEDDRIHENVMEECVTLSASKFDKEDEEKAIQVILKERPDALVVRPDSKEVLTDEGNLVWARWNNVYYPALYVSGLKCHLRPALPDKRWVFWLAEGKVSEVCVNFLLPLTDRDLLQVMRSRLPTPSSLLFKGLLRLGEELTARGSLKIKTWTASPAVILKEVSSTPALALMSGPLSCNTEQEIQDIYRRHAESYTTLIANEINDLDNFNDSADNKEPDMPARIFSSAAKEIYEKALSHRLSSELVCLACGLLASHNNSGETKMLEHPVFRGGLCTACCNDLVPVCFAVGYDGCFLYCTVCGHPGNQVMCGSLQCGRSFCETCLALLVGSAAWDVISTTPDWTCFLCDANQSVGLLRKRSDWRTRLYKLCQPKDIPNDILPKKPLNRSIRVLSLFDGISAGLLSLSKANLDIDVYFTSEIDEEAMRVGRSHFGSKIQALGDICKITARQLESLMPLDLVIGGSPCNDLSCANPNRKGLEGESGLLFFEFYRVLIEVQKLMIGQRGCVFWLFENVASMRIEDKNRISRFLGREPVVWDAAQFSAQRRTRLFWGNLPGMYNSEVTCERARLADCITACGRSAAAPLVTCVTTQKNSGRAWGGSLPIATDTGQSDTLWVSEIEKLFGFPEHYTDCNLSQTARRRLLGKSWAVPVVTHLLRPLRHYFSCRPEDTKLSQVL